MAKISARGAYELARTVEPEWQDISFNGTRDHFSRRSYILRSDGKILCKDSFKKTYGIGPAAYSSQTAIWATLKTDRSEWVETFRKVMARRGYELV